jgi:hypothetical protein
MSVLSQRFWRTSNAGGAPARENNVGSFGGAIGGRGLPPGPDLRPSKSLTCSDAMRTGPNGRLHSLLRLTECSHHVESSGIRGPLPIAWDSCPYWLGDGSQHLTRRQSDGICRQPSVVAGLRSVLVDECASRRRNAGAYVPIVPGPRCGPTQFHPATAPPLRRSTQTASP